MSTIDELVVLGGGSWGTALAIHLARCGAKVRLWVHDPERASRIAHRRENETYLPGHALPENIRVSADLAEAVSGVRDLLLVVPSHHCREVLSAVAAHADLNRLRVCSASKGIENHSLLRVSEIAQDVLDLPPERIATLSGPSFALEVAQEQPTAIVASTISTSYGSDLQERFSSGSLRVYTNDDLVGAELGGALKNVIAIGAGAVEGLGLGFNTQAALITRGLAEVARLTEALGGRRETLAGLAGLGDLVLTCTGRLSRNRSLGVALGKGKTLEEHQKRTPMVAEGVRTAAAAHRLAGQRGVEMPITSEIHAVLYDAKPIARAIQDLLSRQLRREGT